MFYNCTTYIGESFLPCVKFNSHIGNSSACVNSTHASLSSDSYQFLGQTTVLFGYCNEVLNSKQASKQASKQLLCQQLTSSPCFLSFSSINSNKIVSCQNLYTNDICSKILATKDTFVSLVAFVFISMTAKSFSF